MNGGLKGALVASLVLLMVGCQMFRREPPGDSSGPVSPSTASPFSADVMIDSVVVPRGGFGELVVYGRGFMAGRPGRNTVTFGGAAFNQVPASDDGRTLRFTIPDALPTGGEAQPAPLMSGAYTITVSTPATTSNVKTITIIR
jgi:hypothetical protein